MNYTRNSCSYCSDFAASTLQWAGVMIPMVKNYKCPFCTQESSRRFNMEVHIKRRHHGVGLASNNPYRASNARSFGYPNYNLKSNFSPSDTIFNDEESVWGQMNRDDWEDDHTDRIITFLSN